MTGLDDISDSLPTESSVSNIGTSPLSEIKERYKGKSIPPRSERTFSPENHQRGLDFQHTLNTASFTHPKLLCLNNPPLALEELPSDEQLEALRKAVNYNELICECIPTNAKLREIQTEGKMFRIGHCDLEAIIYETLSYNLCHKYDIRYPEYLEDTLLPWENAFKEESQAWHTSLDSELTKCGISSPHSPSV